MFIALGIFFVCVGTILIWFHIPYSPTKQQFSHDVANLMTKKMLSVNEVFFESEFQNLPPIIQKYINHCGYIGKPKMSFMKMEFRDVAFIQGRNGPALRIDSTQYNFIENPTRLALIDSSLFGIPFEGYDCYLNGKGRMKGIIGKAFPLFNQTGEAMDKASLVTYLAECLFVPTSLLQGYITFEEIEELQVKATIEYYGISASGIFNFNEAGEMISFTTNDRAITNEDGTMEYLKWSALCRDYEFSENAIKYPTHFQGIWNYEDGDFIYFDGKINRISYND
ncbi:MAG: hypothetical protein E7255_15060 [Lachnospiraceae bacterium]|nr:hypothetical protein [Lachnospiraceae bacterium]